MAATEFMESLMAEFRQLAASETIVGEAKVFGALTLIPVIRIGVGVLAGGGGGPPTHGAGSGNGHGVGGGARRMAAPGRGGCLADAFEHPPDVVTKAMKASEKAGDEDEA